MRFFSDFPVETGLDHRVEDAYERRPAELGQGLQADFGPEERQSHRLLLRISPTGKSPQDEVRRVRLRLPERKFLITSLTYVILDDLAKFNGSACTP